MGSFATSLHVKTDRSTAVIDAVRQALLAQGYKVTDEAIPHEPWERMNSPFRGIHVSEARDGWVSLLDSDGIGALSLGGDLSGPLQTHAIQFFVNDSDSWHYHLSYAGRSLDEFDSVPDDDEDFGDEDDEVPSAGAGEATRLFQERALQLQEQLIQRMPPELLALKQQWMTTGQVMPEDVQKYQDWMRTQAPDLVSQIREMAGGLANHLRAQRPAPAPTSRLRAHLEHLRPLLKSDVPEARVLEVLGSQETFAENVLSEFLPLLGIAARYAYLGYDYLRESTSAELARDSIRLVEHLKFKKASNQGAAPFRLVR